MRHKEELELQRNNVTPAQFLAYVRQQIKKHGLTCIDPMDIDLDYFKAGNDMNFHYYNDPVNHPAAKAETSVSKPYEMQTYVLNWDGTVFNHIMEFDFDDEKTGHGYFYFINTWDDNDNSSNNDDDNDNSNDNSSETKKEDKNTMNIYGSYFYGNKISDYGLEHGYVDYGTLAKAFDAVLNNDLMSVTCEIGYWEQVSGMVDNSDEIDELNADIDELKNDLENIMDLANDAFDTGDVAKGDELENKANDIRDEIRAKRADVDELENEQNYPPEVFQWFIVSDAGANILQEIDEIVYYNETLDIYLWGVTHYGTSWDYVLTNIPCNTGTI